MKRILYLLLVSAPIFSMQQDAPKVNNKQIKAYTKTDALVSILYGSIHAAVITRPTAPIVACFPTIGINHIVLGTAFFATELYNRFNAKYEIRERSSVELNKESSSTSKLPSNE